MATKTIKVEDYKVGSFDKFFFDTNIWLLVMGAISGAQMAKQRIYSRLLKDINTVRATIYLNSMVLSEYVNRELRLGFKLWKDEQWREYGSPDFKRDYRTTQHFKDTQASVYAEALGIIATTIRKPDDFHLLDMAKVMKPSLIDFNDECILDFCARNGLILVTEDADMLLVDTDVKILTTEKTIKKIQNSRPDRFE